LLGFASVLKHPHTNMMHFSSANSICNIQYFPFFIDYNEGNTECGEQTVTMWTAIKSYVLCVFNTFVKV